MKELAERLFGPGDGDMRWMAVVERFKQESMNGLSAEKKKSGRFRVVSVVEWWPFVEVRL